MALWCVSGKRGHDGDHDEADYTNRAWIKTLAHNCLANLLVQYLRACGMQRARAEEVYWDERRRGLGNGVRWVPDIGIPMPSAECMGLYRGGLLSNRSELDAMGGMPLGV